MENSSDDMVGLILIGGLALLAVAYVHFLPAILAYKRRHPSRTAILILNAFFGWTLIGWVLALLWALAEYDAERDRSNWCLSEGTKGARRRPTLQTAVATSRSSPSLKPRTMQGGHTSVS
jgi:hypothetical protein